MHQEFVPNNLCKFAFSFAFLVKVKLLHGCFSRFLNCANVTKSRNTSQMIAEMTLIFP